MKEKRGFLPHFGRFSVRALLIAVTVFGIWLGLHMRSVNRQRASIEAVKKYGGWVYYDYEVDEDGHVKPNATSSAPKGLLQLLGVDHFHDVARVNMVFSDVFSSKGTMIISSGNSSPEILQHLVGFPRLRVLLIRGEQANDEKMALIGRMKSLRRLHVFEASAITDAGVAQLAHLRDLRALHLPDSRVTANSLERVSGLPALEELTLSINCLDDETLKHFRKMPQLRSLQISVGKYERSWELVKKVKCCKPRKSPVTNEGLASLTSLKNPEFVCVDGISLDHARWLQERLPKCWVGVPHSMILSNSPEKQVGSGAARQLRVAE